MKMFECRALSPEDIEDLGGFEPIPNLKPGDKVTWKSDAYQYAKYPELGQSAYVHRVLEPPYRDAQRGMPMHEEDFTILVFMGGTITEYSVDSRCMKRV